jgi:hypothetical protein
MRLAFAPMSHTPYVGAAARCDLLMFKNKINRSQPRFTRQLLQGFVQGNEAGRPKRFGHGIIRHHFFPAPVKGAIP